MVFKNVPGVFVEEISLLPPSVVGVETGIPAFIGHTAIAQTATGTSLSEKPTRILSLREYEELFGKASPEEDLEVTITRHWDKEKKAVVKEIINAKFADGPPAGKPNPFNLYYAMQLYFANGGGPCYIISVGKTDGAGPTAANLKKGLEALKTEDEPTMIVIPEAAGLGAADYFGVYNEALQQCADLKDRVTIIDVKQTGNINDDISKNFRTEDGGLMLDNLRYGAAYYPYLETIIDYDYTGKEDKIKVTIVNIDADGNALAAAPTPPDIPVKPAPTNLKALEQSDNLLFEQARQKLASIALTLPPSAAIAGIYARVDSERGVWKAPANVGIAAISGTSLKLTDAHQNFMNIDATSGKSVNAIRTITGRGTVVWGARTLMGNSNEWRYINVRRFFNYVEESVKKATYPFVFEPNDANTWVKVRAMIENFLTNLWRDGALQGAKPEQAFTVRIGLGQTMTALDVLEGRMIVEIGMAVVRPAEFIYLRFSHKLPEA